MQGFLNPATVNAEGEPIGHFLRVKKSDGDIPSIHHLSRSKRLEYGGFLALLRVKTDKGNAHHAIRRIRRNSAGSNRAVYQPSVVREHVLDPFHMSQAGRILECRIDIIGYGRVRIPHSHRSRPLGNLQKCKSCKPNSRSSG